MLHLPLSAPPSAADSFAFENKKMFRIFKRVFDIVVSMLLLPVLFFAAVALLALNPWANKGPLIFKQQRMGQHCKPFIVYKFRTMLCEPVISRGPDDPLELNRITKLGAICRKLRIDEIPQIINVIKGDMSLIGPRPDYLPHAIEYLAKIPQYNTRHCVRPGISGLAQVEIGYVSSVRETRKKVAADIYYIKNATFRLELWIICRTIKAVLTRKGT